MLTYIFGFILRILWLPFHSIAYIFGYKSPIYNYNYYSKADYALIMKSAFDEEGRKPTYDEYVQQAKETINKFINSDAECIVFHVDARVLLKWLEGNKLQNTHANRTRYASIQRELARSHGVVVIADELPILTNKT